MLKEIWSKKIIQPIVALLKQGITYRKIAMSIAFGITLMISVQALINFAVVTGCVPTKGLALPFISYGGSSLLVSGVMIGILINIAHSSMHAPSRSSRSLFKDRLRKV